MFSDIHFSEKNVLYHLLFPGRNLDLKTLKNCFCETSLRRRGGKAFSFLVFSFLPFRNFLLSVGHMCSFLPSWLILCSSRKRINIAPDFLTFIKVFHSHFLAYTRHCVWKHHQWKHHWERVQFQHARLLSQYYYEQCCQGQGKDSWCQCSGWP